MSDAGLRVSASKRYPDFGLDVAFDADPGTLVLFGASGAGKTTILDAIAGLVTPDAGEIELHGRTLYRDGARGAAVNLPTRERRVGYVLQEYALFPHMSVLDNVAFPLRRLPRTERMARAREILARVHMDAHAQARPEALSGGQRQRVAIARALASDTGLLLLDEPFAALDDPLRARMQQEIRTLQEELGLIVLLVTHRLEDAFAMGDRIAVLHEGRVEQIGSVEAVFRQPATERVAQAMGVSNLIRGVIAEEVEQLVLDWRGVRLAIDRDARLRPGMSVLAYVRPEDIRIVYPDRPPSSAVSHNVIDGVIVGSRQLSAARVVQLRVANGEVLELRASLLSYAPLRLEPGEHVRIAVRREGIVVLDAE
jgi:ABC-type Fe3+/spermidine/putrescine transport system ATPase subunit